MADVARRPRDDRRGVSTTLGYVLNLGVATILVTLLLLSAGTLVETQRDSAARTELRVVGERVAADLAAADRLAEASDDGTVRLVVETPPQVAGAVYEMRVNESGNDRIVLAAAGPGVEVSVPFATEVPVTDATVHGGDSVVTYDAANDTLVVEDA